MDETSKRAVLIFCGSLAIIGAFYFLPSWISQRQSKPTDIRKSFEENNYDLVEKHQTPWSTTKQDVAFYNFIVYINSVFNVTHTNRCGGVLIASDFVLTAAHCVDKAEYAEIWIGITDLAQVTSRPFFMSKHFIIHEKYDKNTKENDIALIQLCDNVDLSEDKGLAELYQDNILLYPEEGSILKVLGWGAPNSNNTLLREKFVTLDLNVSCNIYENENSIIFTDHKNGPYHGDSGGPLLHQNYILGIVSGEPCGRKSYSSVDYFYYWIWSNIIYRTIPNESCNMNHYDDL